MITLDLTLEKFLHLKNSKSTLEKTEKILDKTILSVWLRKALESNERIGIYGCHKVI